MLTKTTHFWHRSLLGMLALMLPLFGLAQNLTQADFTGIVVPQYASSGTALRLPVAFRATVSNLTPNTLYRYYNQAALLTAVGTAVSGAGNPLLITPGATPAATAYVYTSSTSLTTAGGYATFTTNAAGSYTGWFAFLNTGNAVFTAGNVVYPSLVVAPDATPATIEKRLLLNQGLTMLALGTGATATDASGLKGSSAATPKNLVAVYDNATGTGRPLGQTVVEAIAATGAGVVSLPAYYTTATGDWNTLVPNTLPSGVRRVEQRSVVDGTVVGCASDADGVWPSGANTVSPVVGTTVVALTATDAALSTCGAATTPTLTVTPATLAAFSATVGTASASQTLTVGGTSLTADLVVTAPAGYEVSLTAASGYAVSATVTQTGGIAPNTPVYVRLTGTAVGTFAGNVGVASTGATATNVAVTGTVTTVVVPAPTIASFTPATGPVGTTVTVTGTNFTGATGATLNGLAVTNFMVMSATSVMFDVPATATTGAIAVTTPGGTATSTTSFTVIPAVAPPTITSFTPARAVSGAGFTLNVSGTNLVAGTTISFNGTTYAGTVVGTSGTSYSVVIPGPGVPTVGSYPITATNSGGTSAALSFIVVAPATSVSYEDFEQGVKAGYAAGPVTLRSGEWTFTDALMGNQFNDRVNQVQAARIRGGSIAMNFDKPTGAGVVTLNAGLYGTDATASFVLEFSVNGGASYTVVPGTPAALTTTLTPYSFTLNRAGNVRLRISSTNTVSGANPRINIDDLNITDFVATGTTASSALPGLAVFPNPASDRITVALPTTGAATVALRDLTGRLVLPTTALAADQQLRLPAGLAAGVYLLEVRQGGVLAVRRVEKK